MPASTDLGDERYEPSARPPPQILSRKLVIVPLLGAKAWLGRASLAEARVRTAKRDDAYAIGRCGAGIGCVFHDVKACIGTNAGITLLSPAASRIRADSCTSGLCRWTVRTPAVPSQQ